MPGDNPHTKLDRIIELWRDLEDDLEAESKSLQTTAAAWGRNVRYSDEQKARADEAEARIAAAESLLFQKGPHIWPEFARDLTAAISGFDPTHLSTADEGNDR